MPRFYMHLHECETLIEDETGMQCEDADAAREAAIHAARDVMCGEVREGRLCLSCRIVVIAETGHEVASVPFKEAIQVTGL